MTSHFGKLADANQRFAEGAYTEAALMYQHFAQLKGPIAAAARFNLGLALRRGADLGVSPYADDIESDNSKPIVNWIIGDVENIGWAYGNNASRLKSALPGYRHRVQSSKPSDVAVYFDVLLHERYPVEAGTKILRVGGPRPLDRVFGGDNEKLARILSEFNHIICLNQALAQQVSQFHNNVHVIPNGLDIQKFRSIRENSPQAIRREFVIGFAGSAKSRTERHIKGLDLVVEAASLTNSSLISVGRGPNQSRIPHDRMVSDFYGKIDVLVHPVAAGREGSSNVIMEALASGVPVITTKDAGFHAERLIDCETVLFSERNVERLSEQIVRLQEDPELRTRLSRSGASFADRFHDIHEVAHKYELIIEDAISYSRANTRISFVPFWTPPRSSATGRLRSIYPSAAINSETQTAFRARVGYDAAAEVVVISQLASDVTLSAISENSSQFVIYDVCDRYFDDNRQMPGIGKASDRFFEVIQRANVLTVPTLEMKEQLEAIGIQKPIVHLPDGLDYSEFAEEPQRPSYQESRFCIGWFGNPGRGNLQSAVWMLRQVLSEKHDLRIITKPKALRPYPDLEAHVVPWSYDGFTRALAECDVTLVSHDPMSPGKSPNRLLTSLSRDIPAIVFSSPASEEILRGCGLDWAVVANATELSAALDRLRCQDQRRSYLESVRPILEDYKPEAIAQRYRDIVSSYAYSPGVLRGARVLFISHNLNHGEGAPTSLLQLVLGLKKEFGIEPEVFAPQDGNLRAAYENAGVSVVTLPGGFSKDSLKKIKRDFYGTRRSFNELIGSRSYDLVVGNTAKSLPFVSFALDRNMPVACILRESSEEHLDFSFVSASSELSEAGLRGLRDANRIFFVSSFTQELWKSRHGLTSTAVIHNGIQVEHWRPLLSCDRETIRAELGLPLDKQLFLSVGTINRRKSQIDILRAFAKLPPDRFRDAELVLVGARSGNYLDEFLGELATLPKAIQDAVKIVPEVPDAGKYYAASDFFVFASTNESYPRVIIEAQFFGLPVISSRVFGVQEQVQPELSDGVLFEIGDVEALSRHLEAAVSMHRSKSRDAFLRKVSYGQMLGMYARHFAQILADTSDVPEAASNRLESLN